MTKKLVDPKILASEFISRPHFACRIRVDYHDLLKAKCKELNCSQGVLLEVLISKMLMVDAVTDKDVYSYSAHVRWLHKIVDDYKKTGVMMGAHKLDGFKRDRLLSIFSKVIAGEISITDKWDAEAYQDLISIQD